MWALLAVAWAAEPPQTIDWTSLDVYDGAPLADHARHVCEGQPDGVLAAAVVTYSRKRGNASWGHSSLRFLRCEAGTLRDEEFEYYRLAAYSRGLLARRYPGAPFLDDADWLRHNRGALVLFRNDGTVDDGYFGLAQASNREILEQWLPPEVIAADALYATQSARLAAQEALMFGLERMPERYDALGDNCTVHLQRDLPPLAKGGEIFPWAWWRGLRDAGPLLTVLYPSHHAARRWLHDAPQQMERLHPVLRSPKRLTAAEERAMAQLSRDDTPAILVILPTAPAPLESPP